MFLCRDDMEDVQNEYVRELGEVMDRVLICLQSAYMVVGYARYSNQETAKQPLRPNKTNSRPALLTRWESSETTATNCSFVVQCGRVWATMSRSWGPV